MNEADVVLLARFLDDDLSADERAAFEARLEAEPALAAELELQRKIDASLQARFAEAPDPAAILARAQGQQPAGKLLRPVFGVLIVAAAAALLIALLPLFREQPDPSATPSVAGGYKTGPPRPLHVHYANRIKAWKPDWVCETEEEFRQTFAKNLGQALSFKATAGVKALGLAYVNGISSYTIALLAEVDGEKVMVFVDQKQRDKRGVKLPKRSKLHLHKREVGDLVLYELSPLPEPKVLGDFETP